MDAGGSPAVFRDLTKDVHGARALCDDTSVSVVQQIPWVDQETQLRPRAYKVELCLVNGQVSFADQGHWNVGPFHESTQYGLGVRHDRLKADPQVRRSIYVDRRWQSSLPGVVRAVVAYSAGRIDYPKPHGNAKPGASPFYSTERRALQHVAQLGAAYRIRPGSLYGAHVGVFRNAESIGKAIARQRNATFPNAPAWHGLAMMAQPDSPGLPWPVCQAPSPLGPLQGTHALDPASLYTGYQRYVPGSFVGNIQLPPIQPPPFGHPAAPIQQSPSGHPAAPPSSSSPVAPPPGQSTAPPPSSSSAPSLVPGASIAPPPPGPSTAPPSSSSPAVLPPPGPSTAPPPPGSLAAPPSFSSPTVPPPPGPSTAPPPSSSLATPRPSADPASQSTPPSQPASQPAMGEPVVDWSFTEDAADRQPSLAALLQTSSRRYIQSHDVARRIVVLYTDEQMQHMLNMCDRSQWGDEWVPPSLDTTFSCGMRGVPARCGERCKLLTALPGGMANHGGMFSHR